MGPRKPKDQDSSELNKYFETLPAHILRPSELSSIFFENRAQWGLKDNLTFNEFCDLLTKETKFRRIFLAFPSRKEVRYIWGEQPLYALVMSLKPGGYLSHYTAMYWNDLTEQVPRTIYLNAEQPPPSKRDPSLDQAAIDRAFQRKARVSNNIASYDGYKICLINGMGQGRVGVVEMEGPRGEIVQVTNLERTLIDIAVRPGYAGGVFEVLKAFQEAKDRASVNRLAAMLKQLNYLYPYHQVIGFYLERSGVFDERSIDFFRREDLKYDFYLVHNMKDPEYSERWRLYFPKGF